MVEQTQGGDPGEAAVSTRLEGASMVKAQPECMVRTAGSWQVGGFGPEVGMRHEGSDRSTAGESADHSEWCAAGVERTGFQRACSDYPWHSST